jgi:hypothetical protein
MDRLGQGLSQELVVEYEGKVVSPENVHGGEHVCTEEVVS